MINNIKKYATNIGLSLIAVFITFALLDAFWLGWFSVDTYQTEMKGMLREDFIRWPWLIFYLMYGFVTFVLAVVANRDKPWFYASIDGALLGLASYGAYNLTNYSILEGFTLKIMLVDWSWGIFLTASSATAGWLGFQFRKPKAVDKI
ncbi:DUF2177 family protein [Glaciecola sp. MH2013]|uniref:DUF2177 family protein n=1 Tax=Glaciecola sp. MH2013 TaxID=2785524 RepID=UPI0018A046E8|nr:DUF2177 family protein [Glaciecola sp. MH2013]MBF7075035.1 DUF2177 family protein [Glaciecola sp. MH2013]